MYNQSVRLLDLCTLADRLKSPPFDLTSDPDYGQSI